MKALSHLKTSEIDKHSHLSRYYQVAQKIRESIVIGLYRKGDLLPSERRMQTSFGVSRLTVRKALEELARDGVIDKQWGRGMFVKKNLSAPLEQTRNTIGLTLLNVPEVGTHPVTMMILQGLGKALLAGNYSLEMVFISAAMAANNDIRPLLNKDRAGVIVAIQEFSDDAITSIQQGGVRTMILNHSRLAPSVSINFNQAARELTAHLLSLGHRRIALLNSSASFDITRQEVAGYSSALTEAGLGEAIIKHGNYDYDSGYQLTEELIAEQKGVTAIIYGDDYMAWGGLDALKRHGRKCPEDMSLCAFGDFTFSKYGPTRLTAARIPFHELGQAAGENLISLIEGKTFKQKSVINCQVVARQTTGVCS